MKLAISLSIIFMVSFQDWVVQKIDDHVTLGFPVKPTQQATNGRSVYNSEVVAERFKCAGTYIDYATQGFDSATLAEIISQPTGLQNIVNGVLQANKGFSEISKKSLTISNRPAFEVLFDTGSKDPDKIYDRMCTRGIVVGSKIYSLYFYYSDKKPNREIQDKFFNSFTLTK